MKVIESKNSYSWILLLGGLASCSFGIINLNANPFAIDSFIFWLSLFLILFGLICLFHLIDQMSITLTRDGIKICSLIRKRFIRKKDIIGYGFEKYKGKHVHGERVRIMSKNKNFKFTSSQFGTLEEVKNYLSPKKKIDPKIAFRLERNMELAYLIFIILPVLVSVVFIILLVIGSLIFDFILRN